MKVSRVQLRRRKPDEVTSAKLAIKNFCLECVGYKYEEVKECTAPECWLFPWRFGNTPKELKRILTVNNLPNRKKKP